MTSVSDSDSTLPGGRPYRPERYADCWPNGPYDLWWSTDVRAGSGVAKALITLISGSGGGGVEYGLDYDELAWATEFSIEELRDAVELLVERGLVRIERGLILLLTPSFLATEAREAAAIAARAAERDARRSAKIALRGGQVNRLPIPPEVRTFVLERDGYACVKCGALGDLTLDHIHPWSLGGPDTAENLRVLCRSCNSSKGDTLGECGSGEPCPDCHPSRARAA